MPTAVHSTDDERITVMVMIGVDPHKSKVKEGKTPKEALRALKRRISDTVFRRLVADAARARQ